MNRLLRIILPLSLSMFFVACQKAPESADTDATSDTAEAANDEAATAPAPDDPLAAVLDAQSEEHKARYKYRNPRETLDFFGIEPGMTVLEGLPGRGWYTKVLLPYLGEDGHLIAANYSLDLYPLFSFADEEFLARQNAWLENWPTEAAEWGGESSAKSTPFHFGTMPEELAGTADAVLFVRALHNLARFEISGQGDFLTAALADVHKVLKPGGVIGVVQHQASEDMPDEWATGSAGYLKKSFVIERIEAAGFEFVGETAINENEKDQPTTDDFVWRLPPTYFSTGEDPELKAQAEAIGESHRMTLKFRKPE